MSAAKAALLIQLAGLATLLAAGAAHSQSQAQAAYPDKPVKIMIGFPAGGPLTPRAAAAGLRWRRRRRMIT